MGLYLGGYERGRGYLEERKKTQGRMRAMRLYSGLFLNYL